MPVKVLPVFAPDRFWPAIVSRSAALGRRDDAGYPHPLTANDVVLLALVPAVPEEYVKLPPRMAFLERPQKLNVVRLWPPVDDRREDQVTESVRGDGNLWIAVL